MIENVEKLNRYHIIERAVNNSLYIYFGILRDSLYIIREYERAIILETNIALIRANQNTLLIMLAIVSF